MFIETSAKAGYNVKQVRVLLIDSHTGVFCRSFSLASSLTASRSFQGARFMLRIVHVGPIVA